MRRALAAMAAAAAVASTAVPANAAQQDPRVARAELLVRIADLTDRLEEAEAGVVNAQSRQQATRTIEARTRAQVRAHAVAAYIHGGGVPESARRGPAIYLEIAARKRHQILLDAVHAQEESRRARDVAETARADLREVNAELDQARQLLDAEVAADDARRAEELRRADEARRQALLERAAAERGLKPRHRVATQRQVDLMAKYPFGPLAPGAVPAGLRTTGQRIEGLASWYGPGFHGRATASGAIYDQEGWTTASRDLPLGTMLIVSRGDRRVLLLVNDRGPYVYDRVLDLSHAAAVALGVGVTPVVAEIVVPH